MSRCQDFCEIVNYLNGSGFMTLKSGGVKIEEKPKKKGRGGLLLILFFFFCKFIILVETM